MRANLKIAAACVLGVMGSGAAAAAELIILSNQGATPGVPELATAFSRASGHKVTVIQETGAALERRIDNGPADLITGNPEPMDALVKKGKIVAGTVTPFVLAESRRLGAGRRAEARHQHRGGLQGGAACRQVDRLFLWLQRHPCCGRDRASLGSPRQLKAKTVRTGGGPVVAISGERRLRDRHPADQHHGGRAGDRLCRATARISEQAVPVERRLDDGLEGAGGRARDDRLHDLAGGRPAAAQDPCGAGQALKQTRRNIACANLCWE